MGVAQTCYDDDVRILHCLFEKGGDRHTTIFTNCYLNLTFMDRGTDTHKVVNPFVIFCLYMTSYDIFCHLM